MANTSDKFPEWLEECGRKEKDDPHCRLEIGKKRFRVDSDASFWPPTERNGTNALETPRCHSHATNLASEIGPLLLSLHRKGDNSIIPVEVQDVVDEVFQQIQNIAENKNCSENDCRVLWRWMNWDRDRWAKRAGFRIYPSSFTKEDTKRPTWSVVGAEATQRYVFGDHGCVVPENQSITIRDGESIIDHFHRVCSRTFVSARIHRIIHNDKGFLLMDKFVKKVRESGARDITTETYENGYLLSLNSRPRKVIYSLDLHDESVLYWIVTRRWLLSQKAIVVW